MLLRLAVIGCVGSLFAYPQTLVPSDSREGRQIARYFSKDESKAEETKLRCSIVPFPARLSFGFTYWTGYDISVPVAQFATGGRDRPSVIAVEVRPEARPEEPRYFFSRAVFPRNIPQRYWAMKNVEINLGGGFVIGAGKYAVSLLMVDSLGRQCRKSWKVDAKQTKVPLQIAVGEVRESGMEAWKGSAAGTSGKVSIYLHAAPLFRRRVNTKLSAWDRNVLLGSLKSVLDVAGFSSARVVVFDFDGRRVLYERDEFSPEDYERLVGILGDLSLGTVSVKTLQGPDEEAFFSALMGKEVERKEDSDAIVFLGPSWRWGQKVSPYLREIRGQLPPAFYVSLTPWFSSTTDLLQRFVRAGSKGKVLEVYEPQDLAKAIQEIREGRN